MMIGPETLTGKSKRKSGKGKLIKSETLIACRAKIILCHNHDTSTHNNIACPSKEDLMIFAFAIKS